MKKFLALLPLLGLIFVACDDDDDGTEMEPMVEVTNGSADFSNYVALGNSLTAGFSDGALFRSGQAASLPNMLATQFAMAGGGSFEIPLMADDLGGMTLNGIADLNGDGNPEYDNRFILSFASGSPTPTRLEGQGSTEIINTLSGSFNNMGVPGAKSYHLLAPGYGNVVGIAAGLANPYFARFASGPTATVLGDAVAQNPTFFTLWIGNNDVLGYVTAGGDGEDQTGNEDFTTYGSSDISDPNVVAGSIQGILDAMVAIGAQGVIANLPDVTTIPFLTTVPFAPLSPANPDFAPQIPALNAQFAGLNQAFDFLGFPDRKLEFSTTAASAVVIKDEDLVDLSAQLTQVLIGGGLDVGTATVLGLVYGQARQATAEDLLVLTSQGVIAEPNADAFAFLQDLGVDAATAGQLSINGITWPLEDQWVLTPEEQATANTALIAYNQLIEQLAQTFDLAFVDANALLANINENGFPLADGSVVTSVFATGGGFSLDGVHPSPRGYAILANAFIGAINEKYGSTLPEVNPLAFTGLYLN